MSRAAEYIHGTTPSEQERLAALNRLTNDRFLAFVDLEGARDILEVGCGMGILTEQVARRAPTARVTGIEYSPEQLARAPAPPSAPANLSFVQGDAHELPFADGSFDVVYCRYVLEHVADPAQVLREMRRVLRPRGRAFVLENDNLTLEFDPPCPKFLDMWARFVGTYPALGGDGIIGRKLFRLFKHAGFSNTSLSAQMETHHSGQPTFEVWGHVLRDNVTGAERHLISQGRATKAEIDDAVAEIESHLRRDDATIHFYWHRAVGTK